MEKTDAPHVQVQSAKGRSAFQDWPRVLAGSILFLAAMYAVILGALHTHFHIHHDTKHKHKDDTAPGTQVLQDRGGDDLTASLTTFHLSGDAAVCGLLLHGDFHIVRGGGRGDLHVDGLAILQVLHVDDHSQARTR